MVTELNWLKLAAAIELYKLSEYTYIDVPWKIPTKYLEITFPQIKESNKLKFIGSAEQAFLYLDLNGKLKEGKFVSCTPCVRKEPKYDDLHLPYFMKVELYQNYNVSVSEMSALISDAYLTMSKLLTTDDNLATVKTEIGFDIQLNGIEVGSYGIRRHEDHEWIYGTGLAEPRFSTAMAIGKENEHQESVRKDRGR